jgi:hypothetical protein
MSNSLVSWWAAAAASAMTLAIGVAIGALAQVDGDASGLPVVQLERVEVVAKAPLAGANEVASSELRSRRAL